MESTLNVISFNCRGFRSSEDHIRVLAEHADTLCLQEHWLLKEQLDLLGHVKMDMFFTAVSPMRSNLMGQGRPYGGAAIMWKELQKNIQVQKTPSDRLCAISIDLGVRKILVASVYMPCDLEDVTSSDDYEELEYLDGLVNSPKFDSKIIIGDFN